MDDSEIRSAAIEDQLEGASAAYFFVPLPEPLPLPTRTPFTFANVESASDHFARMAAQGHDSGDGPALRRHISMVCHQVTGSADAASLSHDLFTAANTYLPWANSVPRGIGRHWERLKRSLRKRRLGSLTAPELTFMEVGVYLPDPDDPDAVSDAFDEALAAIRHLQGAFHLVRHQPLTLCRRETLPVAIPFAIGILQRGSLPKQSTGLSLFLTNMNVGSHTLEPDLDSEEIELLRHAFTSPPHAFSSFVDLTREARLASDTRGDQRTAAIMAGAASEALLDTVLLHMMWEESADPVDVARTFEDRRQGLTSRVTRELAKRVGGSWDLTKDHAYREWHEACYGLRNRAVHGAYFPTPQETHRSIQAVEGMLAKIGQSLRDPARRQRYPRTLILIASPDKLRQEGLWTGAVRKVALSADEPNWAHSFGAWVRAVETQRAVQAGTAPKPDAHQAKLLYIVQPDAGSRWVLHDHEAGMACLASRPPEADQEPLATSLSKLHETVATARSDTAHSVLMTGGVYQTQPLDDWAPAHTLVPDAAVLLDRSDPGLK